jgi:branched-chain amino acid transport system permease protein
MKRFDSLFYILAAIFIGFLLPLFLLNVLGIEIKKPEQHLINAIWRGSVYSLFALGYALIFSILGLLNLAHSSVFMWGSFLGLMVVKDADLPLWAALPAGMLGGGLVSVAVDWVAFRPLRQRNAPRTAQLISSIGASAILVNLASITFSTNSQRFPESSIEALPINATDPLRLTGAGLEVVVTPLQIGVLVIALLLMVALQYLVAQTQLGKEMRVVAFNQRTASLLGIHVGRVFMATFFLAGALAGAAGVLHGIAFNAITPFMGNNIALTGLTVIVLGGMGSIRGTVVGGFLIANIEVLSIAAGYSWLADAVVFTALFLMLLIRPQGLLGEAKLDKV